MYKLANAICMNATNAAPGTIREESESSGTEVSISTVYDVCKGVMGQLRSFDGRLKGIEDKQARFSDAFEGAK